jgi:hypothetical protein
MNDIKNHAQNKRWTENLNISFKMLKYATDEFEEGNFLSCKTILESLTRNIKENFKDIP